MKSSTVKRSALSKESIEVIENLSSEQASQDIDINETITDVQEIQEENNYIDGNKSQEIDLLWQSFKPLQLSSNTSFRLIAISFLAGVLVTSLVFFSYNKFSNNKITSTQQEKVTTTENETQQTNKVVIPTEQTEDTTVTNNDLKQTTQEQISENQNIKTKKYVVKNGDTGESIIKNVYGSYSQEKAEQIVKLNNLKSLDRINIDQVLLLPLDK